MCQNIFPIFEFNHKFYNSRKSRLNLQGGRLKYWNEGFFVALDEESGKIDEKVRHIDELNRVYFSLLLCVDFM